MFIISVLTKKRKLEGGRHLSSKNVFTFRVFFFSLLKILGRFATALWLEPNSFFNSTVLLFVLFLITWSHGFLPGILEFSVLLKCSPVISLLPPTAPPNPNMHAPAFLSFVFQALKKKKSAVDRGSRGSWG